MYEHGVIVGKFLPPHRGHHFLIETALPQCRRLTVIVCERTTDPMPGPMRLSWLREEHPRAECILIDDRYDEHDSKLWAENVIRWLGHAPDVVFTSEDYGDPFAHHLGCAHVLVDRDRRHVPCSGTAVRNDPYRHWDHLSPGVRQWYARRVCIVGAESTGTTTLAAALAERLQTNWVEEYGREYCAIKFRRGEHEWRTDEFVAIAREQSRREDEAARRSNRVLICDTNAFATSLWHRRYLGHESFEVAAMAAAVRCDLYVLTGDETPFVQDGLRDGEHIRHEMHEWFRDALDRQSVPWIEVRGPHAARLATATEAVSRLFADSAWSPPCN